MLYALSKVIAFPYYCRALDVDYMSRCRMKVLLSGQVERKIKVKSPDPGQCSLHTAKNVRNSIVLQQCLFESYKLQKTILPCKTFQCRRVLYDGPLSPLHTTEVPGGGGGGLNSFYSTHPGCTNN